MANPYKIQKSLTNRFWDWVVGAFMASFWPYLIYLLNANVLPAFFPKSPEQQKLLYDALKFIYDTINWIWGYVGLLDEVVFWGATILVFGAWLLGQMSGNSQQF